jgi:hypothetical protein
MLPKVIDFFLALFCEEEPMSGQRIGSIRVSSFDQNPAR